MLNSKEDEFIEFLSDDLISMYMNTGMTREEAADIVQRQIKFNNNTKQKERELTIKRLGLVEIDYKLKRSISYAEGDTLENLSKKYRFARKHGYYKIAADNLLHLSDMGEDIAYLSSLVESLQLLADHSKEYTYDDILLVLEYHDKSENQKYFHPGDLIIGVNNKTFKNFNEFLELRDGKNPIQVLQIKDNRFELKTISCEGILGLQLESFNGDN